MTMPTVFVSHGSPMLILEQHRPARAFLAALGEACGEMDVPQPDYTRPGSFGSLELREHAGNEFIGQTVSREGGASVPVVSLDSLELPRLARGSPGGIAGARRGTAAPRPGARRARELCDVRRR